MIAGEYAVLEPGQKAVVASVNRFVTVSASFSVSSISTVNVPKLGLRDVRWIYDENGVTFDIAQPKLNFVAHAISVALQFLQITRLETPICLSIESELDHASGHKLGLGSSAATVVGVVAALLDVIMQHHLFCVCDCNLESTLNKETDSCSHPACAVVSQEILFKLAALAHFRAQGSGSGADVAAAVYGGLLGYTAFHPEWLKQRSFLTSSAILQITQMSWPCLSITKLVWPTSLQLCVGWTKQTASTASLVAEIRSSRSKNETNFQTFIAECSAAVDMILSGLETAQTESMLAGIRYHRRALATLGDLAGVNIETNTLKLLADIAERQGGAGKPSGAGGGDCGIGIIQMRTNSDVTNSQKLRTDWEQAGIEPLNIAITHRGAMVSQLSQ